MTTLYSSPTPVRHLSFLFLAVFPAEIENRDHLEYTIVRLYCVVGKTTLHGEPLIGLKVYIYIYICVCIGVCVSVCTSIQAFVM